MKSPASRFNLINFHDACLVGFEWTLSQRRSKALRVSRVMMRLIMPGKPFVQLLSFGECLNLSFDADVNLLARNMFAQVIRARASEDDVSINAVILKIRSSWAHEMVSDCEQDNSNSGELSATEVLALTDLQASPYLWDKIVHEKMTSQKYKALFSFELYGGQIHILARSFFVRSTKVCVQSLRE